MSDVLPPKAARAYAAELRQALEDLLEWNARVNRYVSPDWERAKALMTRIRDEEDQAREASQP